MSAVIINSGSSDIVKINISNSQNDAVSFERKYSKSLKISDFKVKLEPITGGSAATMKLELYRGDRLVSRMDDDSQMLGYYSIEDGMRVHVIDNFAFVQENVAKFELSQEEYDKKQESLRNYLRQNKLGKYNEEEMRKLELERKKQEEEDARKLDQATIGARCRVTSKGQPTRLGTVMYKGELEGKAGMFIGVKFDEPLGANDGTCNGKRYFECPPKYGSFVTAKAVEIGDFPVEDFGLDDEL
ncbi:tubulin-folding cofactor B [Topomyia yanbarensis]|uniref:tubulin-folding cofactor B n=1 Tax=Topomyia yanbarensis TaxID=2498891 RepID=UPI00273CB117|nr:tubulin-folding cofactor B [Topomyia yanbarensis]